MFNRERHTQTIDEKVVGFISEHHVLTLATYNTEPYCCNCFYTYDKDNNFFVIKSKSDTRHSQEMLQNSAVGGSIVLETSEIGKIQGLQFNAEAEIPKDEKLEIAKKLYLTKFPYAALESGQYAILKPYFMKLTDNRLGFGKKIIWQNNFNDNKN